jgi:SAM-dependent methyltransferase
MVDQLAYWNGPAGERWVQEQVHLDRMLRPFGKAALDAAGVAPGEAVLDVGCGCGDSVLSLAALVGARGRVVGIDPSAPMLALARRRCAAVSTVTLVEGDASSASAGPGPFDLLFSRFGVMFFVDPTRAFRHLRGALRAEGRLAFACWRPPEENPWASVPFEAVAEVLGRPEPPPPDAPGPFSFGDPARVRGILEGAGLRDVSLQPFEAPITFGASASVNEAAREIARMGPVARLLVDRDEAAVSRALGAIERAIAPVIGVDGVQFPGATWIVTARAGGPHR